MAKSIRSTRKNPCPICSSPDRGCTIFVDGKGSICYRIPSDRPTGGGYYHSLGAQPAKVPTVEPVAKLASIEQRHRAYSTLLGLLRLSVPHLQHLTSVRKLPAATIHQVGFRSWLDTIEERKDVITSLVDRLGGQALEGVPGMGKVLLGPSGLAIPVRNLAGQIEGIRIRRDGGAGSKYCWVSSRSKGGASPPMVPFWASPNGQPKADVLRLTEGEFKAITSARFGIFAISVPGVSTWRVALPMLKALSPKRVLLAFDSDATRKPEVARAVLDCHSSLTRDGYRVNLEVWDPKFKGLDDVLLADQLQGVA